jgi:hypothetical protein
MKNIIKYISLLLFSGLILPFYNINIIKNIAALNNAKHISAVTDLRPANTGQIQYFLYQDIAEMLFPAE